MSIYTVVHGVYARMMKQVREHVGQVGVAADQANDMNDMPSAQCYTVLHIFTETKLSEFDPIRTALYSVPHIHSIPTAHLQQPTACSQYIHSVPQNIHSVP